MSVVSNVHQFVTLDKNAKALSGQRLVRLIAKKTKTGEYESENLAGSLAVSVPIVNQDEVINVIDKLIPHIVGLIADTQDKVIREWRIAHGRNEIPESVFDVNACVSWLDANASGDRVTSEYLCEWFAEEYTDIANRWIRSAIDGCSDEVLTQKRNVLRDMFTGFASPKYSPSIPVCKAIGKFVAFVGDSADSRMIAYGQKAAEILTRKEMELSADALGF